MAHYCIGTVKFCFLSDRLQIGCSIRFSKYFGKGNNIHCNEIEISSISLNCFSKYNLCAAEAKLLEIVMVSDILDHPVLTKNFNTKLLSP